MQSKVATKKARAIPVGIALGVALVVLVAFSFRTGTTGSYDFATTWKGILAALGIGEPIPQQAIVELRLRRTLVATGVGAALAYSGALLQGLFRNGLASPSILGVTSGASLGASVAILAIGGYGRDLTLLGDAGFDPYIVTVFAFLGAIGVAVFVTFVATSGGRISVPTLLLVGIAVNVCLVGVIAAVQSIVIADNFEIAQALFMWTFGRLSDRPTYHVPLIWSGLALSVAVIPFIARELDMFASGEEDAQALGVHTSRVKALVLVAAAIAAAAAVSTAGPIAFVGLLVPHILRRVTGVSHKSLLWLSLLGGAIFLLGTDYANRLVFETPLRPGVIMSLVGGPFFLLLLVKNRREVVTW